MFVLLEFIIRIRKGDHWQSSFSFFSVGYLLLRNAFWLIFLPFLPFKRNNFPNSIDYSHFYHWLITNGHFGWWPDIPLQNGTSFSEISLIKFLNVLKMHITDVKLQFFLQFSNWLLLHTNAHTCTHKINWNKSLSLTKTVASCKLQSSPLNASMRLTLMEFFVLNDSLNFFFPRLFLESKL